MLQTLMKKNKLKRMKNIVLIFPTYYLILRRPRHDPPPFLLISRIVKTVILMLRQKLNVKHQVTNGYRISNSLDP